MATYTLAGGQPAPDATKITTRHFGVNVVTIYDQEIVDPGGIMQTLVRELGARTFRFPGGTATELYFDMNNPDSAVSAVPGVPALTPLDDFMAAAGAIGADVSLVVPTRVGLAETAAQAMLSGSYGNRTALAPDYLDDVETFVRRALAEASVAGTKITTLEIGNEFWSGGQMTAAEYGRLAGQVTVRLQALLDTLDLGGVQIVAQATSAASKVYSPRNDTVVYVDMEGQVHSNPPSGLHEAVTVPGQGSARDQLSAITSGLNAVPGAADAVDGSVLHFYQRKGLEEVDEARDFSFQQLDDFAAQLDRAQGAPELTRHITEWNVSAGNYDDNAGLKQASMIAEIFYEMLEHGVSDAQIWPLSFNNAQGTSLTDLGDGRLSIAGEMFRLMQESLPGLSPALDWSMDDLIDIHGYAAEGHATLFLSERSGAAQIDFTLDAAPVMPDERYFVAMTQLSDGGAGGSSAGAEPVVREFDGQVIGGDILTASLDPWANLRVELTAVDWRDNIVQARGGHDRIQTYDGNDEIHAAGGQDYVDGGRGDDRIRGDDGNDWLNGATGRDVLTGGAGSDVFLFATGDGADIITDFKLGEDRLRIDGVEFHSMAALAAQSGITLGADGETLLVVYGAGDQIRMNGMAPVSPPAQGGRKVGTKADDSLYGSDTHDDLRGLNGDDILYDGAGRDVLRGGHGADTFVLARDGQIDRITDFMPGVDRIDLSAWGVAGLSDLAFEIDINAEGRWMGRSYLRWQDETVRMDGLNAAFLDALAPEDFVF